MNILGSYWILIILAIFTITLFSSSMRFSQAILYENGTCTTENLTRLPNQVINTDESVGDFLKSLTSDNRLLAEMVCQNTVNETIAE